MAPIACGRSLPVLERDHDLVIVAALNGLRGRTSETLPRRWSSKTRRPHERVTLHVRPRRWMSAPLFTHQAASEVGHAKDLESA